jgi:hypothetical protein
MSILEPINIATNPYGVELQRSLWKVAEAEKPINRKVTKEIEVF